VKKRNMVVMSMMLFVVLLIGGGTFAWFTAQAEPIVNEFQAGTMEIVLHEEFEPVVNLNPGDCYQKVIYVENTGSKSAYIRILAESVWTPRLGVPASELSDDVIGYGINGPYWDWQGYGWWGHWVFVDGWELHDDGYFYYTKVVPAGGHTAPLLKCNRICFNGEMMGNEYQGAQLDITINAEAIQGTHNAVTEVWGVSFDNGIQTAALKSTEEKLTLEDVQRIIADEEAAFQALGSR